MASLSLFIISPFSLSLSLTPTHLPSLSLLPKLSSLTIKPHLSPRPLSAHFSSSPTTTGGPTPFDSDPERWDPSHHEALLRGGEQVTSLLQEMLTLLEDMELDEESEGPAVEIAAQGVIGKRVDEMESGFMMALDCMIQIAEKDSDHQVTDEMSHPKVVVYILVVFMFGIVGEVVL